MIRFSLLSLTILAGTHAIADDFREWRDQTGQFSVMAKLITFADQTVTIERKDNGKKVKIPLSKFSEKDIAFIRQLNPVASSDRDAVFAPNQPKVKFKPKPSKGGMIFSSTPTDEDRKQIADAMRRK